MTVSGFLVALAAASAPLVATASASVALKNQLVQLSPLATGLDISAPFDVIELGAGLPKGSDSADRMDTAANRWAATARQVATGLHLDPPVFTEESGALGVLNGVGDQQVVLMARTAAVGHVHVISRVGGAGVWVSDLTANAIGVRAGGILRVGFSEQDSAPRTVSLRVKGIYEALDSSAPGPYWANFLPQILPHGVDPPPPVRFVFLGRDALFRVVASLSTVRTFRFQGRTQRLAVAPDLSASAEMAVAQKGLTLPKARSLSGQFAILPRTLRASHLERRLGCTVAALRRGPGGSGLLCSISSSLSSAVAIADENAKEISPVVSLLSGAGVLVALGVAGAAGVFLVRRRAAEVSLLFARGERVAAFAARTAVELVVPFVAGAAAGLGFALAVTGLFAPSGSFDSGTLAAAAGRGGIAAAAGLLLAVSVASTAFVRQFDTGTRRARWVARVPWELPVLAVALWLLLEITTGHGVAASGAAGARHPTLAVFALPLLLVAATAGVLARLVRVGLRRIGDRGASFPPALFLALRRSAAATGILTALLLVSAVAFGAYFYAESLSASLTRSVTEKSYAAYGGDAQALVAAPTPVPRGFPYPVTEITEGNQVATLGGPTGPQADVFEIDPALGSVIRWFPDWGPDPRPLLARLRSSAGPLPVIVAGAAPAGLGAVSFAGQRLPVRVIAREKVFPGMSAGVPLVIADRSSLERAARRAQIFDPLGVPLVYAWARGPADAASAALVARPFQGFYATTVKTFTADPEVQLATRTFRYMRLIAIAAGVLVIVGLLLYLQARQRSQAVSSALAARMGLGRRTEVLSLTVELVLIALVAAIVGGVVALAAASPIISHIDPLPANPPAPALAIPVAAILLAGATLMVLAVALAIATSWSARRTDMSEALRVA